MSYKKPVVNEQEWVKLCAREDKRIPKEAVPHCFGMPILSLPECNHLAGKSRNVCGIRQSCAMAYAERLKIDLSSLDEPGNRNYPTLVKMIQEEEKRLNFVPELGKKAPPKVQEPVGDEELEETEVVTEGAESSELGDPDEEISMSSLIEDEVKPQVKVDTPVPPRPARKATEPPMRQVILDVLGGFSDWAMKSDLVKALETRLNRHPLNPAVLHKVSIVLLPKYQAKYGYKIDKKVDKVGSKYTYSYRLISGTPKSE